MRKILFIVLSFLFIIQSVRAEYILPYPGPMPGNKLYTIAQIIDKLQFYWYWGNIARANYFMELSDKYLVEAKTLFEYKQYLLGTDALQRSDNAWQKIQQYLDNAEAEGKDIEYLRIKHKEQSLVHARIIEGLIIQLPDSFRWTSEKEHEIELQLKALLKKSKELRA
jgi:hypothetical protein